MVKIRCKVSYHTIKEVSLGPFALGVRNGIYDNAGTFVTPPILQPAFELLISGYNTTYAAYKDHTESRDELDISKAALMTGLDTMSTYVTGVANGDPAIIGLGGFEPTKGSITDVTPPTQPQGVTLNRTNVLGELVSDCDAISNADIFGALLVANNPLPVDVIINGVGQIILPAEGSGPMAGTTPGQTPGMSPGIVDLTKSRRKKFSGLQVGVTYYIYYWAINAAGVSVLSEAVSRKVVEL